MYFWSGDMLQGAFPCAQKTSQNHGCAAQHPFPLLGCWLHCCPVGTFQQVHFLPALQPLEAVSGEEVVLHQFRLHAATKLQSQH